GDRYDLKGKITGQASTGDLLSLIPILTSRLPGNVAVCKDNAEYRAARSFLCGFADMTSGAPGSACDMVSVGIGFDAAPAQIGPTVDEVIVPICPPDTDPRGDSCVDADK